MPPRFVLAIALIALPLATASGDEPAKTFRCPGSVTPASKWPNQIEENGVRIVRWPSSADVTPNAPLSQISAARDSIYCTFKGPSDVSAIYLLSKKQPPEFTCFDARMSLIWPDRISGGGAFVLEREGAREKRARFVGTRAGPVGHDVSMETCRYKPAEPLKGATYRFDFPSADTLCTADSNEQVTCKASN